MTKTKRQERLLPEGKPRWIRAYDNQGETIDRYTIVFTGRYSHQTGGEHWVLGMSEHPTHPQGVGTHESYREIIDAVGGSWAGPSIGRKCHLGVRIAFDELPEECQRVVLNDYKEIWELV